MGLGGANRWGEFKVIIWGRGQAIKGGQFLWWGVDSSRHPVLASLPELPTYFSLTFVYSYNYVHNILRLLDG